MHKIYSLAGTVHTNDYSVVALVGFKSDLLLGLQLLSNELLDLRCEDGCCGDGRVDAVCLDGDNKVATGLQEVAGVQSQNTGLIRLCDVGEQHIDHSDEHAVLVRVASVLDNRNYIGALLCHVDKVTARASGELHSVHNTSRSNDICDVRYCGSRSSAEV
eukprot:Mycagemm_TRINITY_DN10214_c0_g1::TRINITY_DN10214_c0_g1_i1::g.3621::m.3621 type:complete len:160 gc:universal TRINITY_DN10214_c0_g1_i1:980-501(-)